MLYTENYQFRKPIIGVDIADVKDVNFNSDKLDALLYNTQISLAPAYDLLETYNTGDIVMYETLMYKCKEDNVTGAWDASKWKRTTAGEEGSGGGGGSSVVPNPSGTPTDTLNTIGIDGTIFDIAGSGGGTGEGSFYKETTLWSGSDSATMQLSESFENYDAIMLVGKNTYNNVDYSISGIWLTSYLKTHINDGMRFGLANDSWYVYFSITNDTTFVKQDQYSVYISEIKGLKFGGGSAGGGLERTLLWDYVTDNNNVIPYGLYTETLHDDIDNYDFIVAEIVSSSGDLSASGWEGTNLWTIDVNALNNTEVQNYLNYTSFGERSSRFYIKDTTFQKTTDNQGNTNGLVRVYGLKWTGSSGSEGDSSYTEVSLFTGTSRVTNMTLSESIKNFDAIEFQAAWMYNGLPYHLSSIITSENLSADNYFIIGTNDYRYVELLVVDDTHINWVGGSDNIMYMKEIKGIKYGSGSGRNSEIIPISAGDGTTSRTFTLERTPKKVTLQGYTSGDGGWYESGYFIWGENFMSLIGAQYTVATGGYAGQVAISYGADGNSFTITAANAFGAFNRADNFSGMMLVDYGGGSGGSSGRTEDVLFEKPYLTANPNTITLDHAFTDYDEIHFWTVKKDDSGYYDYLPINIVPVEYLTDVMAGTISGRTNVVNISGWQPMSQYLRVRVSSVSELTVVTNNNNLLIRKIVGIKY